MGGTGDCVICAITAPRTERRRGSSPDFSRDATATSEAAPTAVEGRLQSAHFYSSTIHESFRDRLRCANGILNRLLCLATPLVRKPGWAGRSVERSAGRDALLSLSHRPYAIQASPAHRSPEVSSLPGAISLGVLRVCSTRAGVQAGLDRLCPISCVTPRVAEPGLGFDRKGPPPPVRLVGLTKVGLTIQ